MTVIEYFAPQAFHYNLLSHLTSAEFTSIAPRTTLVVQNAWSKREVKAHQVTKGDSKILHSHGAKLTILLHLKKILAKRNHNEQLFKKID